MRPPFCALCDGALDPFGETSGLVSFARDPADAAWYRRAEAPGFVGHPPHQDWFCAKHFAAAKALSERTRKAALAALRRATESLVTRGLPSADGVAHATGEYVFDLGLVDGRWWLRIPSVREDRTFWAPVSWEQQEWLFASGLALDAAGLELSWYLSEADARELVRRLAPLALLVPAHLHALA